MSSDCKAHSHEGGGDIVGQHADTVDITGEALLQQFAVPEFVILVQADPRRLG